MSYLQTNNLSGVAIDSDDLGKLIGKAIMKGCEKPDKSKILKNCASELDDWTYRILGMDGDIIKCICEKGQVDPPANSDKKDKDSKDTPAKKDEVVYVPVESQDFFTQNKEIIFIGGAAVVAYMLYKKYLGNKPRRRK